MWKPWVTLLVLLIVLGLCNHFGEYGANAQVEKMQNTETSKHIDKN